MQSELAWSPVFSASYISHVLERKWATKVWMSKSPIFFRLFLTPVLLYRCLQRQGWHFESLQSFPISNVNAISCFLYLFFAGPAEFRWCLLRAKLRRLLLRDSGIYFSNLRWLGTRSHTWGPHNQWWEKSCSIDGAATLELQSCFTLSWLHLVNVII